MALPVNNLTGFSKDSPFSQIFSNFVSPKVQRFTLGSDTNQSQLVVADEGTANKKDCGCPQPGTGTPPVDPGPAPFKPLPCDWTFDPDSGVNCGKLEFKCGTIPYINGDPAQGYNIVDSMAKDGSLATIKEAADGSYFIDGAPNGGITFIMDAAGNSVGIRTNYNMNDVKISSMTYDRETETIVLGTDDSNLSYRITKGSPAYDQLKSQIFSQFPSSVDTLEP